MSDRPIIFSAPMVRALLDGRKTQTRRVLKEQPPAGKLIVRVLRHPIDAPAVHAFERRSVYGSYLSDVAVPYAIGDRLWVRETCRAEEISRPPTTRPTTAKERDKLKRTEVTVFDDLDGADGVRYLADNAWQRIENSAAAGDRWSEMYHYRGRGKDRIGNAVSPIHMPRWASRLTLLVRDVRVQRLQEISDEDAIAEGVEPFGDGAAFVRLEDAQTYSTVRGCFAALWRSIHGLGAWEQNPWVCAVSFDAIRANIDEVPA